MTSQEKKKILLQFKHIDEHIKELELEENLWWERTNLKSPTISDMPKGQNKLTAQQRAVEHLERIQSQIDEEIDRLLILRNDIIKATNKLTDVRERRIIYLAYIGKTDGNKYKRLTLFQIAKEMNYSYDRVKQLHGYALLHIDLQNITPHYTF